jgi:hypothetical protein
VCIALVTVSRGVAGIAKDLRPRLLRVQARPRASLDALLPLIQAIAVVYIYGLIYWAALTCRNINPKLKSLLRKSPFLSRRWRNLVRKGHGIAVWEYNRWRAGKIKEFRNIFVKAFTLCWGTWQTLSSIQRLASPFIPSTSPC